MRGLSGSNPVCSSSQSDFCAVLLGRCRWLIGQLHKRNFVEPKNAISVIGIEFLHSAVRTSQTPFEPRTSQTRLLVSLRFTSVLGCADAPPSSRADRAAR